MQVILKQSEITAALAAYMVNVLGASGVTPETLTVTYKQGRADKNGMTAELEIVAPAYNKPEVNESKVAAVPVAGGEATFALGNASSVTPSEATFASGAQAPEPAQAVDVSDLTLNDKPTLTRDEPVEALPEEANAPEVGEEPPADPVEPKPSAALFQ